MSQQINLFNPIFLKQKKYFSAITMVQGLGLIVLGATALSAFLTYQSISLQREASSTASQLAAAQVQLAQVTEATAPRKKNADVEESIRRTESELNSLDQVFAVLKKGELGNTSGYSDYFKAMARQIVPGVWLTGFSVSGAGNDIGVTGRTLQPALVPEYLGRLKAEPVMKGKSFAALELQLPKAEPTSGESASPASGRSSVPGNYIEFTLQSAEALKQDSEKAGASTK